MRARRRGPFLGVAHRFLLFHRLPSPSPTLIRSLDPISACPECWSGRSWPSNNTRVKVLPSKEALAGMT
ncbi:hypothetical protein EUGRSUZ_L00019 [Eucalyptus grandis]|nr:hypothetical protein EUGRSUZ_L00019 [Eucalyptus grandis]KAK3444240.1 hypothetical protein EUGRSUZ_L00019 [Eucalyptus grandis]